MTHGADTGRENNTCLALLPEGGQSNHSDSNCLPSWESRKSHVGTGLEPSTSTVLLAGMIGTSGSQITVAVTFGIVTDPERVKAALA